MHNRKIVTAILRQVKRWQRYKMETKSCNFCPAGIGGGASRHEPDTARHQAKHTSVYSGETTIGTFQQNRVSLFDSRSFDSYTAQNKNVCVPKLPHSVCKINLSKSNIKFSSI